MPRRPTAKVVDEQLERKLREMLHDAEEQGRLGKYSCRTCGSHFSCESEAIACCIGVPTHHDNGKEPIAYVVRWRVVSGKRRPVQVDDGQRQFLARYAAYPDQGFAELIVALLTEANGDMTIVYRNYAKPLGISRQHWGSWVNVLRARNYIEAFMVPTGPARGRGWRRKKSA